MLSTKVAVNLISEVETSFSLETVVFDYQVSQAVTALVEECSNSLDAAIQVFSEIISKVTTTQRNSNNNHYHHQATRMTNLLALLMIPSVAEKATSLSSSSSSSYSEAATRKIVTVAALNCQRALFVGLLSIVSQGEDNKRLLKLMQFIDNFFLLLESLQSSSQVSFRFLVPPSAAVEFTSKIISQMFEQQTRTSKKQEEKPTKLFVTFLITGMRMIKFVLNSVKTFEEQNDLVCLSSLVCQLLTSLKNVLNSTSPLQEQDEQFLIFDTAVEMIVSTHQQKEQQKRKKQEFLKQVLESVLDSLESNSNNNSSSSSSSLLLFVKRWKECTAQDQKEEEEETSTMMTNILICDALKLGVAGDSMARCLLFFFSSAEKTCVETSEQEENSALCALLHLAETIMLLLKSISLSQESKNVILKLALLLISNCFSPKLMGVDTVSKIFNLVHSSCSSSSHPENEQLAVDIVVSILYSKPQLAIPFLFRTCLRKYKKLVTSTILSLKQNQHVISDSKIVERVCLEWLSVVKTSNEGEQEEQEREEYSRCFDELSRNGCHFGFWIQKLQNDSKKQSQLISQMLNLVSGSNNISKNNQILLLVNLLFSSSSSSSEDIESVSSLIISASKVAGGSNNSLVSSSSSDSSTNSNLIILTPGDIARHGRNTSSSASSSTSASASSSSSPSSSSSSSVISLLVSAFSLWISKRQNSDENDDGDEGMSKLLSHLIRQGILEPHSGNSIIVSFLGSNEFRQVFFLSNKKTSQAPLKVVEDILLPLLLHGKSSSSSSSVENTSSGSSNLLHVAISPLVCLRVIPSRVLGQSRKIFEALIESCQSEAWSFSEFRRMLAEVLCLFPISDFLLSEIQTQLPVNDKQEEDNEQEKEGEVKNTRDRFWMLVSCQRILLDVQQKKYFDEDEKKSSKGLSLLSLHLAKFAFQKIEMQQEKQLRQVQKQKEQDEEESMKLNSACFDSIGISLLGCISSSTNTHNTDLDEWISLSNDLDENSFRSIGILCHRKMLTVKDAVTKVALHILNSNSNNRKKRISNALKLIGLIATRQLSEFSSELKKSVCASIADVLKSGKLDGGKEDIEFAEELVIIFSS